jgi:hypothetical protein
MALCDFCDTCFYFNEIVPDKTQTKELLRYEYCNSDFSKCARYQMAVSRGMDNVPHGLLPNSCKRPKCFSGM